MEDTFNSHKEITTQRAAWKEHIKAAREWTTWCAEKVNPLPFILIDEHFQNVSFSPNQLLSKLCMRQLTGTPINIKRLIFFKLIVNGSLTIYRGQYEFKNAPLVSSITTLYIIALGSAESVAINFVNQKLPLVDTLISRITK